MKRGACRRPLCMIRIMQKNVPSDGGSCAMPLCGTGWQGPRWRRCARPAWPGHTQTRRVRVGAVIFCTTTIFLILIYFQPAVRPNDSIFLNFTVVQFVSQWIKLFYKYIRIYIYIYI